MSRRTPAVGLALSALLAASVLPATTAQGVVARATPAPAAVQAAASGAGVAGLTRKLGIPQITTFAAGSPGVVGAPTVFEIRDDEEGGDAAARSSAAVRERAGRGVVNDPFSTLRPGATRISARRVKAGVAKQLSVVRSGAQLLTSWQGLNHYDTRTADGGNQFSNEPPDQALCTGKGYVVEGVNSAVQVYKRDGTGNGVMSLNRFFGFDSAIVRSVPRFGPNMTDPTCVFDSSTGTFYFVALELSADPATGALTGQTLLDIAVTSDPLGTWLRYRLDVTDDGRNGTPVHPNCPCIGDYPHIGFDAFGFYVTTNEFPFSGGFNNAQVYAFDKRQLARGTGDVYVTQFDTTGSDQGLGAFTIRPAQSPSAKDFALTAGGTEFMLSTNAELKDVSLSDQVVVWSLTGTSTLGRAHPDARLNNSRVTVDSYSLQPPTAQKEGPAPLRDCLNDPTCRPSLTAAPGPVETLAPLDSGDTRMQQVTYTGGLLYGAHGTAVKFGSDVQAGVAWYALLPASTRTAVRALLVNQGQFGVPGAGLIYPAAGVTSTGRGVVTFTLAGKRYYPSAAFAGIDVRGVGPVQVAAAGAGPHDGFSQYQAYSSGTPRQRWGDYSAASVEGSTVWIASEYIAQSCTLEQYRAAPFGTCGGTRTALANWSTRVSQVQP